MHLLTQLFSPSSSSCEYGIVMCSNPALMVQTSDMGERFTAHLKPRGGMDAREIAAAYGKFPLKVCNASPLTHHPFEES